MSVNGNEFICSAAERSAERSAGQETQQAVGQLDPHLRVNQTHVKKQHEGETVSSSRLVQLARAGRQFCVL